VQLLREGEREMEFGWVQMEGNHLRFGGRELYISSAIVLCEGN
jgi:hypothetical protein